MHDCFVDGTDVAPPAGAWIETTKSERILVTEVEVAPPAGAWIETEIGEAIDVAVRSRPLRARGLKLSIHQLFYRVRMSRPLRARGLKLPSIGDAEQVRVCCVVLHPLEVAPPAGAWIETPGLF